MSDDSGQNDPDARRWFQQQLIATTQSNREMDNHLPEKLERELEAAPNVFTLRTLQDEHRSWVEHNFAGREPYYPLLGAMEELGELAHAHLKNLQGIRGTPEKHHADKIDAVADVVIYLADYCTANGIDLHDAVENTWAKVRQRDWKADPINGIDPDDGDR